MSKHISLYSRVLVVQIVIESEVKTTEFQSLIFIGA